CNAFAQCHKDDSLTECLGIFGSSADSSRSSSSNSNTTAYAGDTNGQSSCDHSQTSGHVGSSSGYSSSSGSSISASSRSNHRSGKEYQTNHSKRSDLTEESTSRFCTALYRTICKPNGNCQKSHRQNEHHHSSCRHNKYLQFSNKE